MQKITTSRDSEKEIKIRIIDIKILFLFENRLKKGFTLIIIEDVFIEI